MSSAAFQYPQLRRDESVFDEYGSNKTKIYDPYRHLEELNPETEKWIEAQNQLVQNYLAQCSHSNAIKERLTECINYEKVNVPFREGSYYYFRKNNGLQNQYVLYQIKADKTLDDKFVQNAKVFLDPNELSKDGTVSLSSMFFSKKGSYMAYTIARSGSDWMTIYVKNTSTGEDLPDKLFWAKFTSVAWLPDESGFYYARYPAPKSVSDNAEQEDTKLGSETEKNEFMKIYLHKLGDDQANDTLVYEDPLNATHFFGTSMSDDGEYMFITTSYSTARKNKFFYLKLGDKDITKLIDNFDAEYTYITNNGTLFYFCTNVDAPNSKVICIDILHPEKENWKTVIQEKEDPLCYAQCYNEKYLVVCSTHNVHDILQIYSMEGNFLCEVPLPTLGSIAGITGRKEDSEFFLNFNSFTFPGSSFCYDFKTSKLTKIYGTKLNGMDTDQFETRQVWYQSKDGTRVPMFIVCKKGMNLNGSNPTLLYGYGGFNIAMKPSFSVTRLIFMEHFNGCFALANIRGGDEFGEKWHEAAILEKKQNVFDDFCAAAEYLIDNKYTCAQKIVIQGGSNGGLLVAACALQRPDLFGCVISQVPVLDMLRFHKFTIGYAWCSEYGCSGNAQDFEYLIKYSPLHNIKHDIVYPAFILLTSDHDDRVVPLHSFKFMATMQHVASNFQEQKNPLMIRVEVKSGHGAGTPTWKIIEEYTDIFSFISNSLAISWK